MQRSHLTTRYDRLPSSRNKSTVVRTESGASQQASTLHRHQARRRSAVPREGRTTGVRASGRKTQPCIRRQRSQWELWNSDEEILPSITVRDNADICSKQNDSNSV
jgi:hypothetical protein